MSGRWSRMTAASARPSAVWRARWSRLMSTPSLLPRVSAARPSGLAVGTTRTVVRSRKRRVRLSRAYARSRIVVRQASRPEGSSPCWLHTSSTVLGLGRVLIRTSWRGRPCFVVPKRDMETRLLDRSTALRKSCSSGWVVQRAPSVCSKPVRGGESVVVASAGAATRVAASAAAARVRARTRVTGFPPGRGGWCAVPVRRPGRRRRAWRTGRPRWRGRRRWRRRRTARGPRCGRGRA